MDFFNREIPSNFYDWNQKWEDPLIGRKYRISLKNNSVIKQEIDVLGDRVYRKYFPNITGIAGFKERMEFSKSLKDSKSWLPKINIKLNKGKGLYGFS